jgi:hypothetical protein
MHFCARIVASRGHTRVGRRFLVDCDEWALDRRARPVAKCSPYVLTGDPHADAQDRRRTGRLAGLRDEATGAPRLLPARDARARRPGRSPGLATAHRRRPVQRPSHGSGATAGVIEWPAMAGPATAMRSAA